MAPLLPPIDTIPYDIHIITDNIFQFDVPKGMATITCKPYIILVEVGPWLNIQVVGESLVLAHTGVLCVIQIKN